MYKMYKNDTKEKSWSDNTKGTKLILRAITNINMREKLSEEK